MRSGTWNLQRAIYRRTDQRPPYPQHQLALGDHHFKLFPRHVSRTLYPVRQGYLSCGHALHFQACQVLRLGPEGGRDAGPGVLEVVGLFGEDEEFGGFF
jgi:hypothetical protein